MLTKNVRPRRKKTRLLGVRPGLTQTRLYSHRRLLTQTSPCNKLQYFTAKENGHFQVKNSEIFLIFAQNIDRGYTLEPPHRGGSNEYPRSMF